MAVFDACDFNVASKRKRAAGERDELDYHDKRQTKKAATTHVGGTVPIHSRRFANYISDYPEPLTPSDSSDDEGIQYHRDVWFHRRSLGDTSHRLSSCSMSSVQVNIDDFDDDMDAVLSPTFTLRLGDKTSTHVCSPRQIPGLLNTPSVSLNERMPTPTTTKFDTLNPTSRSAYKRTWQTNMPTVLSPVLAEEGGYFSPVASSDPETMMAMDTASDELNGLTVSCSDSDMDTETEDSPKSQSSSNTQQENGRTAKLQMGFKPDCEKCIQRVPGHYSHIVWS